MRDIATWLHTLPPERSPETSATVRIWRWARRSSARRAHSGHGVQGEGEERIAAPALQHQHYSYLLSQLRQLAVGHRYAVDISVIRCSKRSTSTR
ncbi:MAG TPA: hypothetical protein VHK24_01260 [Steroidobacter sp.]|jgi:cytochrome c553|nr:hypothetical protein [Steroidobacter sp.]